MQDTGARPNSQPRSPQKNKWRSAYYHLSFDLTETVPDLTDWLVSLQQRFAEAHQEQPEQCQPLKILLQPEQQQIGDRIYEVAFIADIDNLPLEFIRVLAN